MFIRHKMSNLSISDEQYEEIAKAFSVIKEKRGSPDSKLDQYFVTEETSIKRALLVNPEAYNNSRIAVLGDMDLVSLPIGKISKPRDLAVLDIDKRIPEMVFHLKFDQKIRAVRYVNHDIRIRMIAVLKDQFKYIFVEPPMTKEGLELGLSRAIQCAKQDEPAKIFLSFDIKDENEDLVESFVEKMNLEIDQIHPDFNNYEYKTPLNKKKSDMYVLNVKENSNETITHHYLGPMYYRESYQEPKVYKCKCGKKFLIGKTGNFSTIEELQKSGCNKCGYSEAFLYDSNIKIE